jgi:hypothetical protein
MAAYYRPPSWAIEKVSALASVITAILMGGCDGVRFEWR